MNKLEAVEQLEDLKEHCNCYSPRDPWDKDVQALEIAIEALKRVAAPEVLVQEQHRVPVTAIELNFADKLANNIANHLTTHGIPSKE